MPVIQYRSTALSLQVEVPERLKERGKEPRDLKRSRKGAIHVRPGGTDTVTADELAYMLSSGQLKGDEVVILIPDDPPPPAAAVVPPHPAQEPQTPVHPPVPEAQDDQKPQQPAPKPRGR